MSRMRWIGLMATGLFVTRAATAQTWVPAKCDIKPGHYLVTGGMLYLKNAVETRFDDQRQKDLKDANRVLVQALTTGDQAKNPAAWYYFGRYFVLVNDPIGVDSTFTHAEQLAPSCKDDIAGWRRQMWVPVFNGAVKAWNDGHTDSAIVLLTKANHLYRGEPTGFEYLARLYAERIGTDTSTASADSAVANFARAVELSGTDPKFAKTRTESNFNLSAALGREAQTLRTAGDTARARVYQAKTISALQQYLTVTPGDVTALAQLASAFMAVGASDSARAIYARIVQRADSVDPMSLFAAGVAIFSGAPPQPDTAGVGNSCRANARKARPLPTAVRIRAQCDSATAGVLREHDAATSGIYEQAAKAFDAGLARNKFFRDALFNLTNTYLAMHDYRRMLAPAQRLMAVDPLSRTNVRLVAAAFQGLKQSDSVYHYLLLSDSLMPVEVTVSAFAPTDQSVSLTGSVMNFHTTKSAPLKLTFEFVDAAGTVVVSQDVAVPALDPSATQPIQLQAIGGGIVAWRYKRS
jgi:tetratricopeptide (TPR) repeat protein